jgi:hypothetical protein
VDRRVAPRRVSVGLNRYLSVGASADGHRLVVTDSKASADLWSVPILDRLTEDADLKPYPVPAAHALAPRFGGGSLFYLSSSGAGDGLWRLQQGKPVEVWKGSDGGLRGPAAVSADGTQVAVAFRTQGLALTVVSADGAKDVLAGTIRGTAAWPPDAKRIVTGGRADAEGPGLFRSRSVAVNRSPGDRSGSIRYGRRTVTDCVFRSSAGGTARLMVRPDGLATISRRYQDKRPRWRACASDGTGW